MAIKVDRPVDFGGDGIVVYVAKSKDEIDKARAGLTAAGIPVELPEAAIEALFAAGKKSLPIRVTPDVYKRALDVIDELFPPPELVLPGDDADEDAGSEAAGPSLEGTEEATDGDAARTGPALSKTQMTGSSTPARKGPTLKKLKMSLVKLICIALFGMAIPGFGIVTAGFGLFGSVWVWRKLDMVPQGETALPRAKLAMGLSGVALVWGAVYVAWMIWAP